MRSAWLLVFLGVGSPGPFAAPAIDAHYDRSCALDAAGTVYCWGDNSSGTLGNGSAVNSVFPLAVSGLSTSIGAIPSRMSYHSCAITGAGGALCWGNNTDGQLGNGTVVPGTVPTAVYGLSSGVAALALGNGHTCALTNAGAVLCWGNGFFGQLGNGAAGNGATYPNPVQGLPPVTSAITAGLDHVCALSSAGGVLCWGRNDYGQLGNGSTTNSALPSSVTGLASGVVAITAGDNHTCARTSAGRVVCWGRNESGQLGNGTITNSSVPVNVASLSGTITQLRAGGTHNCTLNSAGGMACWGSNSSGGLGNGTFQGSSTPVSVAGLAAGVTAIATGFEHTCALAASGSVQCWGRNDSGQLGIGTQTSAATPTTVSRLSTPIAAISTGTVHTCALSTAGTLQCWGANTHFQLGDGQSIGLSTPGVVSGLSGVISVKAGIFHVCALTSAGKTFCWGDAGQGQLGNGSFAGASSVPVATQVPTATAITSGGTHSCALASGGGVCWGDNRYGQLGNGTTTTNASPVAVSGLSSGLASISAGWGHTCAAVASGGAKCWGYNLFGQLGTGTNANSSAPLSVVGLSGTIASVAAGLYHSCALTGGGQVFCWGLNDNGELGTGTTTSTTVAAAVQGLPSNVSAIATGDYHSCAVTGTGGVMCWGGNGFGQLGNGTAVDSSRPVAVSGLSSGVVAISAGRFHTCALTSVGTAFCWGYGSSGGVGDGKFANRAKPVVSFRPGGAGGIATNDWFLDLNPAITKTIPADKIPPYLVTTSGNAAAALVTVSAGVQFRSQDVGKRIFVFAYVPAALAKGASLEKGTQDCVLAQIDASGNAVNTSASSLGSLLTNVQSSQTQAVSVLNNVLASNINGSTLLVGTGQTGTQAISTGNNQCVATVPPATGGLVCACPDASITTLSASAPAAQGATATFTATVSGTSPTGTVQFMDGTVNLGAAVALANGVAALPISTLSVGTHAITAAYSGDSGNSPSTSTALTYVVLATSSVTLSATPSPAILGSAVTLRATVTGNTPTGSVIFRDGTTAIATATVSSGIASTSISSLAVGSHLLSAAYSGDTNNASATSSTFTLQVNAAPPTTPIFTLTPTTYDFGSVGLGSSASTTVTLSNGGASGTISGITGSGDFSVASNTCGSSLASGASCSITLTFKPSVSGSRSGTLSVATNAATSPTCQLTGTGTAGSDPLTAAVNTVITGYYQSILGRAPDAGGQAYWSGEATRVSGLGADVREVFFAMAIQFFNSPEYLARNTSDTQYLTDLYRTFFSRAPDTGGLSYWLPQLSGGMDRGAMLGNFLFSTEFSTTMTGLFGASNPRAEVNLTMDLYRGILGILPDSGGFSFWLGQIRAAQCAGTVTSQVDQISQQFLASAQYQQKDAARPAATRTAMYVGDLYNAFLRRGPDLGGYLFYGGQITSGAQTREQIRQQFLGSPEFQARVSAVIAQGCLQ